ncbi:MAG: hypothetical protein IJ574_02410 [Bacilli bacterium]|nr:hypothetical protein [Bacilli bacterium]
MKKANILVIRKVGKFYQVFDDDAVILWYLFGYRIINRRVGFPISAQNKVLTILEEKKIHYQIILNDEEINFKKGINHYNNTLNDALIARDKNRNIDILIKKIENLNEEKIDKIVNYIEVVANE